MQIDCFDDPLSKTSTGTSVAKLVVRPADAWDDHKECNMPAVTMPARQKGDYLVDYEQKVFEDVKAKPGEKALVTFHTVAFEGSIGFVNMLQATRLMRKGFETDPASRSACSAGSRKSATRRFQATRISTTRWSSSWRKAARSMRVVSRCRRFTATASLR
jgi:hypothetical protein